MVSLDERPVRPDRRADRANATIYRSVIRHQRTTSVARTFQYSSYYWLIDVEALPSLPPPLRPFARFRASDHLGDPAGTLAGNARQLLSDNGIDADQILLLTSPRTAGHVFNPLSVFYCLRGGEQVAAIAEVHNTYGGRHVYLLRPDDAGRDQVEKCFYVSPFLPMGGRYLMRTPVPGDRLSVSIALRIGPKTPFVATLTGDGVPATTGHIVAALLRWPLVTLRTSALIRWQGIRLWLRGIPVQPRPADATGGEQAR
ncbi:hypothetical protein SAMN04515671_1136 [Nakamurella panacisegetis]|uniref:DUF1365 domain-containing protein n=1 Tax=Nakamurella panacisegetis TaxID=1090615 RepID=A0A1H0K2P9_9ACTN|nr:DUF1365 domain-containing protein [Nakamurella panacisegetis]SDO50032.1 hypothetical protein SAMN04515671_1136 [Nakamurella panacisegetis]